MSDYVVITTIHPPTKSVMAFAAMDGIKIVVVGDRKTPKGWHLSNVSFLPFEESLRTHFRLEKHLPHNHYCRKMLGYLQAILNGATRIFDLDDDNFPYDIWGFPCFQGDYFTLAPDLGVVNVYQLFTEQKIWPRGYPLERVGLPDRIDRRSIEIRAVEVGVWQGLVDSDPDVDAIYRLVVGRPCTFQPEGPIVLGRGTWSPFNSQNTAFSQAIFVLLYLPAYTNFRFSDILRGLVAQPIMWLYGYYLGFTRSTVSQDRNDHDLLHDFKSEIPMYLNSGRIIDMVSDVIDKKLCIEDNLFNAYHRLHQEDIVCHKELETLDAWLKDVATTCG
jgi:hypothetical protein